MDTPMKKPIGIVVKPTDLHLYTKENATSTYSADALINTINNNNKVITMGRVNQIYSPEGLKKLLLDPDYYPQLLEAMQNTKLARISINKISGTTLSIGKNTLIDIFKSMIATSADPQELQSHQILDDTPSIRAKIQELQNQISLDNIPAQMPTFTTTIGDTSVTVNTKDIVDFINEGTVPQATEMYGLPIKHFMYVVKQFASELKLHAKYYITPAQQAFISDIWSDKVVDTYALDKSILSKTTDPVKPVPLNPELISHIFNNMPQDYTDIQKAIFVYIKLARMFTYDSEFYAEQQSDEANNKHKDISRLSTITPTKNNNVVCYEANQIYAQLLRMMGINYESQYVLGSYGNGHSNLTFVADDYVVHADTVAKILDSDMLNTKVNNEVSGITCQNKNAVMREKFKRILYGVYDDVKKLEPSPYAEEDSFDKWRELLTIHILDPEGVTMKDKIDIFTRVAQGNKMPTTEKIAYLTKIYNNLFAKDMNHFHQTFMTIISQQKDKTKLKQPTLAIAYNEEGPITDDIQKNQYVLLDNGKWRDISLEELQTLFDSGELGYISNHIVPGIQSSKKETPTI